MSLSSANELFKTNIHEIGDVPFKTLQFNKAGELLPVSESVWTQIVQEADAFSDIFFFSHGWNNDWSQAKGRYEQFIKVFRELRNNHNLQMPDGYNPLLVGVFWPSTALAFGESERGPQKSFQPGIQQNEDLETQFAEDLESVGALFDEQDREELYSLVQSDGLTDGSALRLAQLAAKIPPDPEDEIPDTDEYAAEAILKGWKEAAKVFGSVFSEQQFDTAGTPVPKGRWYSQLDPRRVIRLLTVISMKDRAAAVGRGAVSGVLQQLLDQSAARIHLIGHSYGAKVMLSALSATRPTSRKVHSALLLQPAISHLAFASSIPGREGTGGYHDLLERVEAPILSTFSRRDFSLHKLFHLILRRSKDLGEAYKMLDRPDRYAALGGYGPRTSGEKLMRMRPPPSLYKLDKGVRIVGLNGSAGEIKDHGNVVTEFTAWALYTLVTHRVSE